MELPLSVSPERDAQSPASMALERGVGGTYEAYNEFAFRHFLTLECRRAARSARLVLLLLIDLNPDSQGRSVIAPAIGARIFAALTTTVREIDFIGWYRMERVVGAVLAQGPEPPAPGVGERIGERVSQVLADRLPRPVGVRVHVRLLQVRSRQGD